MIANKLAGLEPEKVFAYFEKLCSIPHGSGNTKKISDYLVSFAKEHGIRYQQDALNNMILFQDGTCGYEDHAPVILQGHMDMVCEKDDGCPINMETDGLDVTHDENDVFAKGTTLGGDNGIAVAYALALLADKSIPHPPLEVVITVDEETTMGGARGIDLSSLKGRTMINLDSSGEGTFTVSCAGGANGTIRLPVQRRVVYGPCVRLVIEDLKGGHSGIAIDAKHANANKAMGILLSRVQELMPICITDISGGAKGNAIPRSAQVTFVALGMNPERINDVTQQLQKELREEYAEPNAVVRGDNVDALGGNALTAESTAKVIALLNSVPNGVQTWSEDIAGLVQTSLNLGIMNLDDALNLTFVVRSSVNQEKHVLLQKLRELAEFHGGHYSETGDYPAWEFKKDSTLRQTMVHLFEKTFAKTPEVLAIHAGLECGFFSEKLPGLDCVAIGPDMHDIHTSRERLNIASTARTWAFLLEILKAL